MGCRRSLLSWRDYLLSVFEQPPFSVAACSPQETVKIKWLHRQDAVRFSLEGVRHRYQLQLVVNQAGGCPKHASTGKLQASDPLASATERKAQDLARPLFRARSTASPIDPRQQPSG